MNEIFFKAGRRASRSCNSYREIIKRNSTDNNDIAHSSDDVITFYPKPNTRVIIDCDKKTGEFRVAFEGNNTLWPEMNH